MATGLPDSVSKRKYWREFLAIYQRSPELWDARHSGYRHKESRNDAYDQLEAKLKEIEPHATRCDVQRRINIFRTNYRRERIRIMKQKAAGLHAEMCKPTLWYYDLMDFLQMSFEHGTRKRRTMVNGRPRIRTSQTLKLETVKCYEPETTALKSDESSMLSPKIEIFEQSAERIEETSNQMYLNIGDSNAIDCNEPTCSITSNVLRGGIAPVLSEASETLAKSSLVQYGDRVLAQESFSNGTRTRWANVNGVPKNRALETPASETAIDWPPVKSHEPESSALTPDENSLISPKIEIFERDTGEMEAETSNEIHPNSRNTSASDCNEPKCCTTSNVRGGLASVLSEASEALAKSWAIQYEEMAPTQRILARKAIADILFEGCIGNLHVNRSECTTVSNHR